MLAVLSGARSSWAQVDSPLDVRALRSGASAVGVDPGAVVFSRGAELQLRALGRFDGRYDDVIGAAGVIPAGPAGLSWALDLRDPGPHTRAGGALGLALRAGDAAAVGLSHRWISLERHGEGLGAWNVGVYSQPAAWLSLSMGIDAFNQPRAGDLRLLRSVQLGAALRPLAGNPWLTVAADARLGGNIGAPRWQGTRVGVDARLWSGLHGLAAITVRRGSGAVRDEEEAWVGLSVALEGLELEGLGAVSLAAQRAHTAMAMSLRSQAPEPGIGPTRGRHVEVRLAEDLFEPAASPFADVPLIPTVSLQLQRMARDPSVQAVTLVVGPIDAGLAEIEELRGAVAALRQAGKPVSVELSVLDDKTFWLASAADEIRLDPMAVVSIDGFAVTLRYFAGALQKLGVKMDAAGIGRYKTAPDALTRESPRPEEIEVQEALLQHAYAALLDGLTRGRGLTRERAEEVLALGILTPREAVDLGVVDGFTYPADVREQPASAAVRAAWQPRPSGRWGVAPAVAVIPILGAIVGSDADASPFGQTTSAEWAVRQLEEARQSTRVRAVVLRVDSPGGDVFAAEQIWRAVRRVAAEKPVVASLGDVAASGGYYVVASAQRVFADAQSLTGSIGIFMLKPDASGLYDWVGIKSTTLKRGERADWGSETHALRDDDRERLLVRLRAYYDAFVQRVAEGRGIETARVAELAEGRVYTGSRAHDLGLVDAIGGLADAVREAAGRAGLMDADSYTVLVPEHAFSLARAASRLVEVEASASPAAWFAQWQRLLTDISDRPLALMPYWYEVAP